MEDKRSLIVRFWSFFVVFVFWIVILFLFVWCIFLGVALTAWRAARGKSVDLITVLCEQYTQRIMWMWIVITGCWHASSKWSTGQIAIPKFHWYPNRPSFVEPLDWQWFHPSWNIYHCSQSNRRMKHLNCFCFTWASIRIQRIWCFEANLPQIQLCPIACDCTVDFHLCAMRSLTSSSNRVHSHWLPPWIPVVYKCHET